MRCFNAGSASHALMPCLVILCLVDGRFVVFVEFMQDFVNFRL